MTMLFSFLLVFGLVAAAVFAIVWIVKKIRHKPTKAHLMGIAALLVAVVGFVAVGITYDPRENAGNDMQDPPGQTQPADDSGQTAESGNQSEEPTGESTDPSEEITLSPEPTEKPWSTQTPEEPPEESPIDLVEQAKQDIEAVARKICEENYTLTTISSVTVNENYGTDEDGDYVLLVYVTWSQKNPQDLTKTVLSMYSEDYAARVGTDINNVSEFTVFWTVPYYSETDTAVKYSYERRDGGMYQTDSMIANFLD